MTSKNSDKDIIAVIYGAMFDFAIFAGFGDFAKSHFGRILLESIIITNFHQLSPITNSVNFLAF